MVAREEGERGRTAGSLGWQMQTVTFRMINKVLVYSTQNYLQYPM